MSENDNPKCNCGKEATHQFNPEDETEIILKFIQNKELRSTIRM